jgi:hypothetical protein
MTSWHVILYFLATEFVTYHLVCNKSNTTGVTSGTGTASPSIAPEFALVFERGVRVVHVVKLHVFTFVVLCCGVHCDFRLKMMFGSSLLPFVL